MPKLSGLQWTLFILIILCLAAWGAMLSPWLMHTTNRTDIAMKDGLYVRILTENGEIQGKTPITAKKEEKPKADEKPIEKTENTPKPVVIEETPAQPANDATKEPENKPLTSTAKEEPSHENTPNNPNAAPVDGVTITQTSPHTNTPEPESTHAHITPKDVHQTLKLEANEILLEPYQSKSLPIISSEGIHPSQYYAKPDSTPKNIPAISLTISGLGLNEKLTLQAIEDLPPNISLSFSPYAKNLESWFLKAKKAGHETWLDIPMEFANYPANDPGPLGLLKGKSEEENITRLKNTLSTVVGYVGVIAPKDEIFTGYAMMHAMNEEIAKRGLLLLLRSRAFKPDTDADGILYSSRSLIKEKSHTEIMQSLSELEIIAKDYGYAIGIADASTNTLTILKEWQKDLEDRHIKIIPLSAVNHRRK